MSQPDNALGLDPLVLHNGQGRQRSSSVDTSRGGRGTPSTSVTQVSFGHRSRTLAVSSSSTTDHPVEFPWLKSSAQPSRAPPLSKSDDRAIQDFFTKYTLLPYEFPPISSGADSLESDARAQRASQGFLEFLPCTFEEVNVRGRYALRWAVQATALADAASQASCNGRPGDTDGASNGQAGRAMGHRALECYGKALSALSNSLGRQGKIPDDYDLMTVVILDLFEVSRIPTDQEPAVRRPLMRPLIIFRLCSCQMLFLEAPMPRECPKSFGKGATSSSTTPADGVYSALHTIDSRSSH